MLAWLINELHPVLKTVFTLIFYAPSLANVYTTWQLIFSGDTYGIANSFLMNLGFINGPIQWLTDANYILTCVIIVQLWISLGAGFLALRAGFQGIDKSQYEAGAIEGIKNRWQELIYIKQSLQWDRSSCSLLLCGIVSSFTADYVGRHL